MLDNDYKIHADAAIDKVYKTNKRRILRSMEIYKNLYSLPVIEKEYTVSKDILDYCKKRDLFIIIAVYNELGQIFCLRNFEGDAIKWALPGGSIRSNLDETIEDAVFRVINAILKVEVCNLRPVSYNLNRFIYEHDSKIVIQHRGLSFMAQACSKIPEEVIGKFLEKEEEIQNVTRWASRDVYKGAKEFLLNYSSIPPDKEISTARKYKKRYDFHRKFVSRLFKKFSSAKVNKKITELIDPECKIILDTACGDDKLIFDIAPRADLCVGNDISWETVSYLIKNNTAPNIVFTNHNITELPFAEKYFDVAICKNTLHHLRNAGELEMLFDSLKKVAKKIILVDIEDPKNSMISSKIWNYYYKKFLGDLGGAFFNKKQFEDVVKWYFHENEKSFDYVQTIKGKYMFAGIKLQ